MRSCMHTYIFTSATSRFHTERDVSLKVRRSLFQKAFSDPPLYTYNSNRALAKPLTILLVCSPFEFLEREPFNEIVLSVWHSVPRIRNNAWDSHGPCFPGALQIVRTTNAKHRHCMNIYLITGINKCLKVIHRG